MADGASFPIKSGFFYFAIFIEEKVDGNFIAAKWIIFLGLDCGAWKLSAVAGIFEVIEDYFGVDVHMAL